MSDLDDSTSLGINIKLLIQIIVVAAMIVWGYFGITSKITQIEIQILRMEQSVKDNSEFRIKWPRGELGSLPDDAEQNMRLKYLEAEVGEIEDYVDKLRINANME